METDEALDLIPEHLVATDHSGMRCEGERCAALEGKIGVATRCTIYEVRPEVCRECQPNDHECLTARAAHGITKERTRY